MPPRAAMGSCDRVVLRCAGSPGVLSTSWPSRSGRLALVDVGPLGPLARGGRVLPVEPTLRGRGVEDPLQGLLELRQLGIHVEPVGGSVVVAKGLHRAAHL